LVEVRICGVCEKIFYSLLEDEGVVCPYCGDIVVDMRDSVRVKSEEKFIIFYEGKKIPAKLKNYSRGGLGIVYKDKAFKVNTSIKLNLNLESKAGVPGRATTVWSRALSGGKSESGLRFLQKSTVWS